MFSNDNVSNKSIILKGGIEIVIINDLSKSYVPIILFFL